MDRLLSAADLSLSGAARALGIPRPTLEGWQKLDKLPETALATSRWGAFVALCVERAAREGEEMQEGDARRFHAVVTENNHAKEQDYVVQLTRIEEMCRELREAIARNISRRKDRHTG